jgi:GntR family transcriptional regulator/MocR family aminotransferase
VDSRGITARPGQIIIVPSAQAGIALITKVMIDAGDIAWIESPGYGGALSALRSANAAVVGTPIDAGGLRITHCRDVPRIIFVTPSHQYPTGRMMPVGRRLELLQFASSTGAMIIEDDYDGEFHYEGRPVAALAALAPYDRTIYLGTFSKAMFADIRVGYLIVPEGLAPIFALAQRHLGLLVAVALQAALADFIAAGYYRSHVRRMTRLYRTRRDQLALALSAEAGERLRVDIPDGGMQLLARCDASVDDVELSRRLEQAGVTTRPLSEMLYHKSRERGLFLGFAAWKDTEIEAGVRIIGRHVR